MTSQTAQKVLRSPVQTQLANLGKADILAGIPCYHNEDTIAHVVQTVSQGLQRHYPDRRAVLLIADGGSTDDTRERSQEVSLPPQHTEIVTIYRGISGKGSALRTIFAAAEPLQVHACLCLDADLRSITPDWIRYMLDPILAHGYGFVAPFYARYKYDGTITNTLVYCLMRALYGKRVRQPIGGDFAFSRRLACHYLQQPVWGTDIARFGIDIWMTLEAIIAGASICQTNLGVKLHDPKDPAIALGPMFQQVCGTLLAQIEKDVAYWSRVQGSEPIPTLGLDHLLEPEPIAIDHRRLVDVYQSGFRTHRELYHLIFSTPVFQALQRASEAQPDHLHIPDQIWARLLYEIVATYHHLEYQQDRLLPYFIPLYLGQVASFMNQTADLDFASAEAVIDALARQCEQAKPYLLELWQPSPGRRSQMAHLQRLLSP